MGFYEVRRFIRFDLIDHADDSKPFFDRNDIAPMIPTTRRERDFIEPGLLVCAGDNFFPFVGRNPIGQGRVFLQNVNDVKPRESDRLD